jgi:hypothetical protein
MTTEFNSVLIRGRRLKRGEMAPRLAGERALAAEERT